jgi:sec-independent protein translocase protein TatB
MFDAGFTEVVLIFIIGLLVLGPERLPRVASQIGRWVGRARRTANQLRYQLEREIAMSDIRKPPKKPERPEPSTTVPPPAGTSTSEASKSETPGEGAPGAIPRPPPGSHAATDLDEPPDENAATKPAEASTDEAPPLR